MVAALLVKTGNSAGYQHSSQTILATSPSTLNYFLADTVAKSCVFGPSAGANLEEVSRLENWALAHAAGDNGAMPYLHDCKALCEYRLGHFAEAVEWAEKPTESLTVLVQPHSYATLAMAKWRLGKKAEAVAMLAKREAMAPGIMPESTVGKTELNGWLGCMLAFSWTKRQRSSLKQDRRLTATWPGHDGCQKRGCGPEYKAHRLTIRYAKSVRIDCDFRKQFPKVSFQTPPGWGASIRGLAVGAVRDVLGTYA